LAHDVAQVNTEGSSYGVSKDSVNVQKYYFSDNGIKNSLGKNSKNRKYLQKACMWFDRDLLSIAEGLNTNVSN
jgi:hypothetical protein